jgi:hypothetical protein
MAGARTGAGGSGLQMLCNRRSLFATDPADGRLWPTLLFNESVTTRRERG